MAHGDGTGGAGKSEESEVQASGMTKTDGAAMKRLRQFLFLGERWLWRRKVGFLRRIAYLCYTKKRKRV